MKTVGKLLIVISILLTLLSVVYAQKMLPDLELVDVYLDNYCHVNIAIANRSPVGVQHRYYNSFSSAILLVYLDNVEYPPWSGGTYLREFDPNRYLSYPYGSVTFKIYKVLPLGRHKVKVLIHDQDLQEASIDNNKLIKYLTCNRFLPDLIIKDIRIVADSDNECRIEVIIKNIGGSIDSAELKSSNLIVDRGNQKRIFRFDSDLMRYCKISPDPLMRPGGEIRVVLSKRDPFSIISKDGALVTASVDVKDPAYFITDSVPESNEHNNSKTKWLKCLLGVRPPIMDKIPWNKRINSVPYSF